MAVAMTAAGALTAAAVLAAPAARATPSPRARPLPIAPPRHPLAVVVTPRRYGAYTVSLVDLQGHIVARALANGRAVIRTPGAVAVPLPDVGTSSTRVYYLDGDAHLRFLLPDGRTGTAATLPGGPRAHAAFAVSADDRRVAVSLLDYSARPPAVRIYVQNLDSAVQTTLYTSNTVYEWPVGWSGSAVVLAVLAGVPYVQRTAANPYNAFDGYHVVDVASHTRLAELCTAAGLDAVGPLVAAGTVCLPVSGTPFVQTLTGATHPFAGAGAHAVLAPDGLHVAESDGHSILLLDAQGRRTVFGARGLPQGWIDATHLLISAGLGISEPLSVLSTSTGRVTPIAGLRGSFAATLPGPL